MARRIARLYGSARRAAAFGYRFDDGDRAACAALADLAQLCLALELQVLAARPRLGGATPVAELAPATPQPSALAGAARRTFTRERSLRIVFTPFEG
jgi:hypothetical protein